VSAHLTTHLKCPHCDKKFSGPKHNRWTIPRLKGCLVMHIKAHHPEKYVPSEMSKKRAEEKAQRESRKRAARAAIAWPPSAPEHAGFKPIATMSLGGEMITKVAEAESLTKPKRPYVRKAKAVNAAELVTAKFCPECGCNMVVVNEAVKMARGQ